MTKKITKRVKMWIRGNEQKHLFAQRDRDYFFDVIYVQLSRFQCISIIKAMKKNA